MTDALCEMVKLNNNSFFAYESILSNFIDIGNPFGALKASINELDEKQKQEIFSLIVKNGIEPNFTLKVLKNSIM